MVLGMVMGLKWITEQYVRSIACTVAREAADSCFVGLVLGWWAFPKPLVMCETDAATT